MLVKKIILYAWKFEYKTIFELLLQWFDWKLIKKVFEAVCSVWHPWKQFCVRYSVCSTLSECSDCRARNKLFAVFWIMLVLAVLPESTGSYSNDLYKTWNKNRDWMICRKCIARIIPKLELSFMSLTELMTLTGFCHWVSSPGFKQEYSDINPKFKLFSWCLSNLTYCMLM